MHKILITGASGFLGRATLQSLLLNPEFSVFAAYRKKTSMMFLKQLNSKRIKLFDSEDELEIKTLFSNNKIDTILHLATNYGRHNQTINSIVSANLVLPLTLLVHGLNNNVQHFINIDSFYNKVGNSHEGLFDYSQSKKALIPWLVQYSNQLRVSNLVLEHMYGPGDAEGKFIPTFIKSSLCNFTDGLKLTSGYQERDFIFIEDVVAAILAVVEEENKGVTGYRDIGVGCGKTINLIRLAEVINSITGNSIRAPFSTKPYEKNEIMFSKADISELLKLGWTPKIDLVDGLRKTIEFYDYR